MVGFGLFVFIPLSQDDWFIDVVQDSPSAGLGIPVETEEPLLLNQYTGRETPVRQAD